MRCRVVGRSFTVPFVTGHRDVLDQVEGLRSLAIAQAGVVRRDQLAALGVSRFHVRSHVAAHRWRALGPNLVVLSTGRLRREQELIAGPLHCGPSAALDGWSALERDGLKGWTRSDVHVVVPHGTKPAPLPGLVVHQSRQLPDVDIVGGPPRSVTTARAAIDAAGWLPTPRSATGLVLAVAQQRLATAQEMLLVLDRVWRVRHTPFLREVLGNAEGLDSRAELDLWRLARSVGFRDMTRQARIETPEGSVPVDLALTLPDGRRLLVEVDGPSHDDPRQRVLDAQRDARLIALGYVVLRFPAVLIRTDPESVRARLLALWRS